MNVMGGEKGYSNQDADHQDEIVTHLHFISV